MPNLDILNEDIMRVAQAHMQDDVSFALQVKCTALIRMLEELEAKYLALQEKHRED